MTYTPDPEATYTTNYALEKPSHGSHDGTWEMWIASAFDMIDSAIAAAAATAGTTPGPKGDPGETGPQGIQGAAGTGGDPRTIVKGVNASTTTAIPAFSVVHFRDGRWAPATNSGSSTCDGTIGINLVEMAVPTGQPPYTAFQRDIVLSGIVTNPAWSLNIGASYYVGNTAGTITRIAPYYFSRFLGFALSPTELYVCPNEKFDPTITRLLDVYWDRHNIFPCGLVQVAGESIISGAAIRFDVVAGRWKMADATTMANCSGQLGLASGSYAVGEEMEDTQIFGVVELPPEYLSNTTGPVYYISETPGLLTAIKPTIARVFGHSLDTNFGSVRISINPSPAPEIAPVASAATLLPGQCSTSIAVGSVVHAQPQVLGTYLNWELAEPTLVSELTIVGIVQANGSPASVAVSGIVPIPETSILPGYAVWLGAGGTLSDTPTGAVPRLLGWVVDSTHLLLDSNPEPATTGGSGDVLGPASSADNAIARFDSTTGKLLQNSGATLSDTGVLNLPTGGGVTVNGVALGGGGGGDAATLQTHPASDFALAAKGVTNGDSHDHNGGDGGQIAFGSLSGVPTSLTPTAHATSHKTGGADAVKLDELAAPTDVTTLNASTAAHGLCPKGDANTAHYLRGDLTWGTPAGGSGGAGVTRLAAITSTIPILTSDAGAGKSGTIDLTATTGQIARIRLRADFLAGQQATPGTFQVNNASGISATATTIAYDTASAGMVLATGGGDIIQIDGERILTATGTTTAAIAVATRGYNRTVATYHDDNAVGFKCSDGLRLELYPNSNYLPTERLLTLRGLMTGQWLVGAAGVTNGASFVPLTTSPAVISDFGAGSLIAILDTATDYARVQDIYGLVADSGTVNSIRTQTVRPAHAASVPIQRVLDYDLPVPFAFASGTSLYYKLFVDEKYTATVTVNVELIVDKYT